MEIKYKINKLTFNNFYKPKYCITIFKNGKIFKELKEAFDTKKEAKKEAKKYILQMKELVWHKK